MATGNGTPDHQRATRRQFFRVFGRQTVSGANNVLAGVDSLRRSSQDAIGDLLGGDDDTLTRDRGPEPAGSPAPPPSVAYRSAYRFSGSSVELLDQRELPARSVTIECGAPSEVASALRRGVVSGGPVLGQLAAYALVAAAKQAGGSSHARLSALDGAADTLRAARPTSRPLAAALERMLGTVHASGTSDDATLVAALTDEADRIAAEAALDHPRLGRHGADALRQLADAAAAQGRPLQLLVHGDQGPLVGGQVGLGVAAIQQLAAVGLATHAWLTEAAPLYEGRRAAWQLGHLEIAHTLVPDTALVWLLANRPIDALLLRAEWLLADGSAVTPLGSAAAAREARAAGAMVVACAPMSAYDPGTSAADVPTDLRLPAPDPAAGEGPRIDPAGDLVPATLIDVLLTDAGAFRPPFAADLAAPAAARTASRGGQLGASA